MQNVHAMRPAVREAFARALAKLGGDAPFRTRLERWFTQLRDPLVELYGEDPRFGDGWERLLDAIARTARERPEPLRVLDHEREITPDWLHREQAVGYVAYVDRFAGTLAGVHERLPYLRELGVNYLHLMPLLHARPEPNDGGYAVVDYGAVEPALGSADDLRELAARAGDERMLARYLTYEDRSLPDAYERTLPEVFPDIAPGSFTREPELERRVWTTFDAFQWDLDHTNPDVFVAMAEAIVVPRNLVPHLDECDLAYHNVLMVLLWPSLATGKVALMTSVLRAMPPVSSGAGWLTYVRCHDDIGWAITEQDAAAVGEDGFLDRRLLSDFYAGGFFGSFARGARFQLDPRTGEARTSGMASALAGDDPRRVLALYAFAFASAGLPLIYMGDELGLGNDEAWASDPAHAGDNRWMHRPFMDWSAAESRASNPYWNGLRELIATRQRTRAVHAQGRVEAFWTGNDHVFGLRRSHDGEGMLLLVDFTGAEQPVQLLGEGFRTLAPYEWVWR